MTNLEMEQATNLLRDALSWFDAQNIDHLPQWVVSARALFLHEYNEQRRLNATRGDGPVY